MLTEINPKKSFITLFSQLKFYFRFKFRKGFKFGLEISLDRQALSEHDMALIMPIYK